MIKWCKIFGKYHLGIWFWGLALFALQEIPYVVMPLIHLDVNPIMDMQSKYVVLDILEKIFGCACIATMILIVNGENKFFSLSNTKEHLSFVGMLTTIAAYFVGWAIYFCGYQSVAVIVAFLVLMPPLYYMCIGFCRKNYILSIVGTLFLLFHFSNVLTSLL